MPISIRLPLRERRSPGDRHGVATSKRAQRFDDRRLEGDHAAQDAFAVVAAAAHLHGHERRALNAGALHGRCKQGAFDQDGQHGSMREAM